MEFIANYGLFLAKVLTIVMALAIVIGIIAGLSSRHKTGPKGELEVRAMNDSIRDMRDVLKDRVVSPHARKSIHKARKKQRKSRRKLPSEERKRVFVLNFKGDLRASAVTSLREEITAVLGEAGTGDEVVVRLESGGGMVHSYGLAASQLDRIRKQKIPLTVCVDKVAASGGYMMACVADKVLAAPFALLGSIGVVAQLPNFHRLLKKHDIDFELLTAGEYKRTLTLFGENTEKGREKFLEDLEETHGLFKDFVGTHRPAVDITRVANGDVWLGSRALELGLVDELQTSDEYLTGQLDTADLFEVSYIHKKTLQEKLGFAAEESADNILLRWLQRLSGPRFFS